MSSDSFFFFLGAETVCVSTLMVPGSNLTAGEWQEHGLAKDLCAQGRVAVSRPPAGPTPTHCPVPEQ